MPPPRACTICRTAPRDKLLAGAEAAGCLVLHVDLGGGAQQGSEMLDAVARGLRFPQWFGHNWDALTDSLLDMGWLPAAGYVVILDHCDGIHGRAEADFVALMQVFQEAADTWREDGVPFWCLVDMQADGIAWLPTVAQPSGSTDALQDAGFGAGGDPHAGAGRVAAGTRPPPRLLAVGHRQPGRRRDAERNRAPRSARRNRNRCRHAVEIIDWHTSNRYEIFAEWRHRYAPASPRTRSTFSACACRNPWP
jgi:hypothetical protein